MGLDADITVHYEYLTPMNRVSFGVARNPYDRCLSSWKYCYSTKDRPLLEVLANPPVDGDTNSGNSFHTPGHDYRHFTRTQWSWLKGADHILRFENLYDDLLTFLDTYDIETFGRPLPRLNVGNHPTIDTLTAEEKSAIYNFYKEDFINLGYDE